jgi:hypothetical protein
MRKASTLAPSTSWLGSRRPRLARGRQRTAKRGVLCRAEGFSKRSSHNKNNSGGNSIEGSRDPALELSGAQAGVSHRSTKKKP